MRIKRAYIGMLVHHDGCWMRVGQIEVAASGQELLLQLTTRCPRFCICSVDTPPSDISAWRLVIQQFGPPFDPRTIGQEVFGGLTAGLAVLCAKCVLPGAGDFIAELT